MTRKGRAHLITGGLLLGLIVVIAVLWANPMVLVWVLLGLMAVMAYGVLYLLVQARMPKADDDTPLEDEGDTDDVDATRATDDVRDEAAPRTRPRARSRVTPPETRASEPSSEVSREFPNGGPPASPPESATDAHPKGRSTRRVKRPASE